MTFKIGTTVRVSRPEDPKIKGRATIATVTATSVDDDLRERIPKACVLWEPFAPKPFEIPQSELPKRYSYLQRPFLITPLISSSEEERENTVEVSNIIPLFDFEERDINNDICDDTSEKKPKTSSSSSLSKSIQEWKDRGDKLLRLGDCTAACPYYEMALHHSSKLQIGSSIIVKEKGYTKIADVDCINVNIHDNDGDNDHGNGSDVEITMEDSGEEKLIQESKILLCILHTDSEDHIQERILLNLARCLLQIAKLTKYEGTSMASASECKHRPTYLRSAVLAATIVTTIAQYHKNGEDGNMTNHEQTALLLRSRAYAQMAKFPNAIADVRRILNIIPKHKEALKQLLVLQRQRQRLKKADKKLVNSMLQFVEAGVVTMNDDNDGVSSSNSMIDERHDDEGHGGEDQPVSKGEGGIQGTQQYAIFEHNLSPPLFRYYVKMMLFAVAVTFPLLIAYMIGQY